MELLQHIAIVSYIMQPSLFKLYLIISLYNCLHTRYTGDKIFQGGSKYFRKLWTGGPNITGGQIFRYSTCGKSFKRV